MTKFKEISIKILDNMKYWILFAILMTIVISVVINTSDMGEDSIEITPTPTLSPTPTSTPSPTPTLSPTPTSTPSPTPTLSPTPTPVQWVIDATDEEIDILAHIIMAEAEGEDFDGLVLVANVIINRVQSDIFPDTIKDVVYQNDCGVYQFSPVGNGRMDRVEPIDDCYEAAELALQGYNISQGALFFERCKDKPSWHSEYLEFLFQHGRHRFYKYRT